MAEQAAPTPPGALARVVGGLIQHSETWGMVWFGLIFWGSVLFAVSQRIWPDANDAGLLIASLAIGLAGGIGARLRGYWL